MKPIIRTYSGKYIEPLNITSEDIDVEDIIVAGSNICRFGGHLDEIYSINEHQLLCLDIAKYMGKSVNLQMAALTHDICEVYSPIGDCLKPCKHAFSVNLDGKTISIEEYEDYLTDIIAKKLTKIFINYNDQDLKVIDKTALNTESYFLRGCKINEDLDIYPFFEKRSQSDIRFLYRQELNHLIYQLESPTSIDNFYSTWVHYSD